MHLPGSVSCKPGRAGLAGMKVLVAEENDPNTEIAAIQLEERGMQATGAVDGKEAVEIFQTIPPIPST